MVSSAVFSDLDVARLTVLAPLSMPRMTLAETICRMTAIPADSHSNRLTPAVDLAAQQLIDIVISLCSPEGGWPADLPQTPDNLTPYVGEEVAELLEAFSQSGAVPFALPSPAVKQTRLLTDWLPQLLWQIASSGYEIMRLMEGIQARLYWDHEAYAAGTVRLVPVLTLTAGELALALDLVTQTVPQADWLADTAGVQLAEGDLVGSLYTVETWIAEVTHQVNQHHPLLADLLHTGWPVEALVPGAGWLSGSLSLCFCLVMEEEMGVTLSLPGVETAERAIAFTLPESLVLDTPGKSVKKIIEVLEETPEYFTLDDFASTLEALPNTQSELTLDYFTLDDFADSIGMPFRASPEQTLLKQPTVDQGSEDVVERGEVSLEPLAYANGFQGADELLTLLDLPPDAGALVLQPRLSAVVGDDLLSAWVTLIDEDWIQTFLQTLAGERFCRALSSSSQPISDQPEGLVQAAYDAIEPVRGADGLFKHTFVHQPVLLADLWPRLRWYLTRTSQVAMEMMGGLPVQWLSPGESWQSGSLHLTLFAVLQLSDQAWYLDLANGQVLSALPTPVLESTVVYPLTPELGQQPLGISEIAQQIESQLDQVRSLIPLRQGVAIELHRLDDHLDDPTGRLHILWQLTLQGEI